MFSRGCVLSEGLDAANRMIEALISERKTERAIDKRISATIEAMNDLIGERISVRHLADSVGLSPGRLGHLFKEQTGLPVRHYFLSLKMMAAVRALAGAASLTEAAHAAGFADSAHMTRTFKRMLGLNPSFFLGPNEFVQVIVCTPT